MNYEKLNVWKESFEVAKGINHLTMDFRDFSLKDQMRRSAVSVPSNIAEGEERETVKESVRYLYIAKGSNGELLTQLLLARSFGYVDERTTSLIEEKVRRVSGMLAALIKYRTGKVF